MTAISNFDNQASLEEVTLRPPRKEDGRPIHQLVSDSGVLDVNSIYAYMLIGEHHSRTSVVAESADQLVAFISAYLHPEKPDTLFVWQVGVAEAGRGRGLATRMLCELLNRHVCRHVTSLETTIGPSNQASQALFQGLARRLNADVETCELFTSDMFAADPEQAHEPEILYQIGPFDHASTAACIA